MAEPAGDRALISPRATSPPIACHPPAVGFGGYFLLGGSAVLFVLLVRELWRGTRPARLRLAHERAHRGRLRAARSAPGGAPGHPIEVPSASVVEPEARSERCLGCDRPTLVDEHVAENHGDETLRVVALCCRWCGETRRVYFRIRQPN